MKIVNNWIIDKMGCIRIKLLHDGYAIIFVQLVHLIVS